MTPGTISSRHSERVVSYATYDEAQEAVDRLADLKFPVERLAIIAGDLTLVEQVTGRQGYGEASLSGLVTGAFAGAFVGFLFGLFGLFGAAPPPGTVLGLALRGVAIGSVAGLVVGLIGHSIRTGQRDFSSVTSLRAGRYDVVADPDVAADARGLLETHGLALR
jgi:hypothetical protein